MSKKKRTAVPDRAAEYIDSPRMTQRLHYRRELAARIVGNYGVYRVQVILGHTPEGRCSCPSEVRPCKHVRALEATWEANPESFFELETVLDDLASCSKADLLEVIAQMALAVPESLAACGVGEFEADGSEEFYD